MSNIQTISAAELPAQLLSCYPDAVSYALLTGDPACCFLRFFNGSFSCAPALAADAPSPTTSERWSRFQEIRLFGTGDDAWHFWCGPQSTWYFCHQAADGDFPLRLYPLLGDRVPEAGDAAWARYRDGRGPEVWVPAELATASRLALKIHHNTGARSSDGAAEPANLVPLTVITEALLLGLSPLS